MSISKKHKGTKENSKKPLYMSILFTSTNRAVVDKMIACQSRNKMRMKLLMGS